MITLLPREQLELLRSVGDAANVLLALILIDRLYPGRSSTKDEIANVLGKDPRTVENRLKSLCVAARAIYDGHGYVLLEGGRALLLAAVPSLPEEIPAFQQAAESLEKWEVIEVLAPTSPDPSGDAQSPDVMQAQSRQEGPQAPIEAQALQPDEASVPEMPDMDDALAHLVHESEEEPTRTMRALLEEEDINLIKSESINLNSSSSRSPQNVQSAEPQNLQPAPKPGSQPSTLQILDATASLFGATMTTAGIADKPRRLAIGWVAQAWDQRKYLQKPQGLIYSRLSKGVKPQAKYYDHPRRYLPENYLVAIGLMAARPAPASEPDPEPARQPAIFDEPVLEDARAVEVWEKVLEQLKQEMHRAPFETWVQHTKGIRFDRNTLQVGTKSQAGQEWLESRVRRTAERLLVGILAQNVAVKFVVVQGE